ncbi:MAG: 16S rRNA methyltransferase G [Epulopiscium sp. Nele67-Bin004]|nr:MAG: 16S rRNA methyltransferase G [Epulopiscium sp. Nele67-Bin004]
MQQLRQMLVDGAKQLNIELSETQVNQLFLYKNLLHEWNNKINLTAITDDTEVITKHFLDCMTAYNAVNLYDTKTLIDVGTGAGFPGLVLKIVFPHIKVTLVDSLNKRLIFLNEVIQQLELTNIVCIHARAEDLGQNKQYREQFDICASRAVANLATLSEYTLPFVKIKGCLIALKGQNIENELETGTKAINILGGKLENIIDANVPFTELNHKIAKVTKISKTPKQYPRKSGEPNKNPLGI